MNKYQEALNELSFLLENSSSGECKKVQAVFTLQELIDKATHKFVKCPKGWQGTKRTRFLCPNCGKILEFARYPFCKHCGQAIKYPKPVYVEEFDGVILSWDEE